MKLQTNETVTFYETAYKGDRNLFYETDRENRNPDTSRISIVAKPRTRNPMIP